MKRLAASLVILAVGSGCVINATSGGNRPAPTTPPQRPLTGTIRLALYRPAMEAGVPESGFDLAKFNEMWRSEFNGQSGIELVPQDKVEKSAKDESKGKYNAFTLGLGAVRVKVFIGTNKKTGFDRRTGKPAEAVTLTYRATVDGPEDDRHQETKVEGNPFQNQQLMKDLAAKVLSMMRTG